MATEAQERKVSRRVQEYQRRRQEIMSAARVLFIAKGFRNTTLDEIADASAFGKGTIYNYFANKDDLFFAIVHELIDESFVASTAAMNDVSEDTRKKLLAYTRASLAHYHANSEVFLMIMREHNHLDPKRLAEFADRYQERLSLVREPLASDVRAGRIRAEDPQKLALLFDGMIRTYFMAVPGGFWPAEDPSTTDMAELIVSVFFDGIENKQNQG